MNCQKMSFDSRAAVNEWRRHQNAGRGPKVKGPQVKGGHAYRCPKCDAWHWTSLSKSEARRLGYR